MKIIVFFCLVNGIAWVWCSYVLAFMGYDTIAESLSQVALAEIIGVTLTYAIKSVVENLSKNNAWPDKGVVIEEETTEYSCDAPVGPGTEEDYVG